MSAKKTLTTEQMIGKLLQPVIDTVVVNGTELVIQEQVIRDNRYFKEDVKWKNSLLVHSHNDRFKVEEIYKWDFHQGVFKLWFMYIQRLPAPTPFYEFWCNGCPADTVIEASKSLFPDDPDFVKTLSNASKISDKGKPLPQLV